MGKKLAAAAAAGLIAGALGLTGTAHAHHNVPELTVEASGECGETTFTTAWIEDTHTVANAVLVIQAGEAQHTAPIGESISVGPFDTESVTLRYRVWGGGERDYDQPPLSDLDALVAHIADGGSPLDADAPGVAWHTREVAGCPEEPDPGKETEDPDPGKETDKPGGDPTGKPSADPTGPTGEPTGHPTADAAGEPEGKAGSDDKLPVTGAALPTLIGAGLLLLVGGGTAMALARRRGLV